MRRAVVQSEKDVQRDVVLAYEAVGCMVANFSQARASKQTPGIPDLYVFPPPGHAPFWHEVKRPSGVQSPPQKGWQVMCENRGVGYVLGGASAALNHLRAIGLISGSVPPSPQLQETQAP